MHPDIVIHQLRLHLLTLALIQIIISYFCHHCPFKVFDLQLHLLNLFFIRNFNLLYCSLVFFL